MLLFGRMTFEPPKEFGTSLIASHHACRYFHTTSFLSSAGIPSIFLQPPSMLCFSIPFTSTADQLSRLGFHHYSTILTPPRSYLLSGSSNIITPTLIQAIFSSFHPGCNGPDHSSALQPASHLVILSYPKRHPYQTRSRTPSKRLTTTSIFMTGQRSGELEYGSENRVGCVCGKTL